MDITVMLLGAFRRANVNCKSMSARVSPSKILSWRRSTFWSNHSKICESESILRPSRVAHGPYLPSSSKTPATPLSLASSLDPTTRKRCAISSIPSPCGSNREKRRVFARSLRRTSMVRHPDATPVDLQS